jgi:hypothetical protein
MNTDEFIQQLVNDAQHTPLKNFVMKKIALLLACVIALSFASLWLLVGIHPEFSVFIQTPIYWVRFALLVGVCVSALHMMWKLSQPFTHPQELRWQAGGSMAAICAIVGTTQIPGLPSESMVIAQAHGWALAGIELGEDTSIWKILLQTSGTITLLALPVFAALIWIIKKMAPRHPALAGASAGFSASALAALEYSFNSPYDLNAYSNLGYFICMATLPLLGAWIGKRWLRW